MKNLLTTFFTLLILNSLAQNQANTWYFGAKAGIQFTQDTVKVLNNSQMLGWGNVFSISDKQGNLLFYGNQCHIWNREHQKVYTNTKTEFVYNIIVVPHPKDEHLFYIFKLHSTISYTSKINCIDVKTKPNTSNKKDDASKKLSAVELERLQNKNTRISYMLFNTKFNQGKGGIETRDTALVDNITMDFIVARHQNDKDFWLLCHQLNSNKFLSFLIDDNGIHPQAIESQAGRKFYPHPNFPYMDYQTMKVSPNFHKIFIGQSPYLYFYDFDNQTGKVSNQIHLYWARQEFHSLFQFSSNSQKFYFLYLQGVTNFGQIDLSKFDKISIEKSLSTYEIPDTLNNMNFLDSSLGPDGKIYFTQASQDYLAIIHNPNEDWDNCNFRNKTVFLGKNKISKAFLPDITHLLFLKETPKIEVGKIFSFPIQFQTGSSQINKADLAKMKDIIEFMQKNPTTQISISGHTDNLGNPTNNLKLSKARAKTLADYLISQKIKPDRIKYQGWGDTQPIADNKTSEGQAKNRRIEFLINK